MASVIPLPAESHAEGRDVFSIRPGTSIAIDRDTAEARRIASLLADLIGDSPSSQPPIRVSPEPPADPSIHLSLGGDATLGPEGYDLTVAAGGVRLVANQAAGLFYGVQTIRQLLPVVVEYEAARRGREPLALPIGRITDRPRFRWRGAMLDVARHFFTPADVKRYIDLLAMHKINTLHLALTNDQGWRIEILSWPNLTAHGGSTAVGGGPGGYYTQAQYRDLVQYAADRFITVVPEIDMPGHTNAALASYPALNCDGVAPPLYTGIDVGFSTLCADREGTYRFVDDVVREVAAMTPGPYFHIGGDEVRKLTADQYRTFVERVQTIVTAHGKRMVGWDEIAVARLDDSSVVQHWRPQAAPAGLAAAPALILSPGNRTYLDMKYHEETMLGLTWAGFIGVDDAYRWDPATLVPGAIPERILGVEAPLWSETLANIRDAEFMAFPRMAAIAEVGWSPQARRGWHGFRRRLRVLGARYTALGINFYRSPQIDWP